MIVNAAFKRRQKEILRVPAHKSQHILPLALIAPTLQFDSLADWLPRIRQTRRQRKPRLVKIPHLKLATAPPQLAGRKTFNSACVRRNSSSSRCFFKPRRTRFHFCRAARSNRLSVRRLTFFSTAGQLPQPPAARCAVLRRQTLRLALVPPKIVSAVVPRGCRRQARQIRIRATIQAIG